MQSLALETNARKQTLHAISEHFYVDTERPTAAQHAKQVEVPTPLLLVL